MTAITTIKTALQSMGYTVNLKPQEKISTTKEVILFLTNYSIMVETNISYIVEYTINIYLISESMDTTIALIPTLIAAIEPNLTGYSSVRFDSITVDLAGTVYAISIPIKIKEVVNVE